MSNFTSSSTSSTTTSALVKNKIFLSDSAEYGLAESLLNLILKRNPSHKKVNLQSWAKHVDHMIRLDKRNFEEIQQVIVWCQADSFWQNNILSAEKLRKQYDQLKMKMLDKQAGRQKQAEEFRTNLGMTLEEKYAGR